MENKALIDSFSEFKDEKFIDRVTLMVILEEVFRNTLTKKFGTDENFDIIINPDKGDLEIWRNRIVVEDGKVEDPNAEIVIMGDLNDEPIDPSVTIHLGANMEIDLVGNGETILWNVMEPWHRNPHGSTYKYGGKDMVYDHLIVSPGMVDENGLKLIENSVGVFDGEKYRQHGGKYDSYPFRFWAGNRLLGGYSDHMPVYLKIESK